MKNLLTTVMVGLAVVMGSFSIGYFVAFSTDQDATDDDPSLNNPRGVVGDQSHLQSDRLTEAAIRSLNSLAELENVASPFQRTVAIHELVRNADEETLLILWEKATRLTPGLRVEAQAIVVQRLAALDPSAAWDIVSDFPSEEQFEFVAAIFREWSLKNLDQAIAHARLLDLEAKNAAVESIVLSREDLTTEQRREIGRQLNTEWLAVETIERTTNTRLVLDPQTEWTAFLQHTNGHLDNPNTDQLRMMAHIAAAWIQQHGVNAIDEVVETLSTQNAVWRTSKHVVDQIAVSDPHLAFELAIHMRTKGLIGLLEGVIREWAEDDPWSAFNAVSSVEAKSLRRDLQSRVLETWAFSDPIVLLDQVGRFSEDLKPLARKKALIGLSRTSPQRASEILDVIRDQASLNQIAIAIATIWSTSDLSSALHWIENEPSFDHNRNVLINAAFSGLAYADPRQALQVALTRPVNEDGVGPEAAIFSGVALSDMDTAIALLPEVREGKTKIEAYDTVIRLLVGLSNNSERAIDLLIQLANEEEIPSDAHVISGLVFGAPHTLFSALDRFEPMEFRRRVAKELLRVHEHGNTFTTEQISVLAEVEQYDKANRDTREQNARDRYLKLLRGELNEAKRDTE